MARSQAVRRPLAKRAERPSRRARERHVGSFAEISAPGAYVLRDYGMLVRVPNEALQAGGAPVINIASSKPLVVYHISDNPWVPIGEARMLAADCDCEIAF